MDLIVVTGASKGLGLAICRKLLSENYKVVGISRSISEGLAELQKNYDDSFDVVCYDLADILGIRGQIKGITEKYGAIYGLVNNAALGLDGVLGTMHDTQISEMIKVNIEAPILLTKYACRSMLLKMRGRVINISSIIASTGFNGLSVYGATKSAMTGFTKSLARELGKANITVNCVAPGYMETEMTKGLDSDKLEKIKRRSPMKKLATVEDVASVVTYLLSEEAGSINATTITVDAGSTA